MGARAVIVSVLVTAAAGGAALVVTPGGGGGGGSCSGTATSTSSFSSNWSASVGGDTLCLASGSYGTFSGGDKSSPGVTIKPADGATVTFDSVSFGTGDDWTIVDGTRSSLTIHDIDISGTANNVTISGFTSPGLTEISPASMNNSAVVIDDGLFTLDDCPASPTNCDAGANEGRLTVIGGSATNNAGVTVRNSEFTGNCADGVQITGGDNSGRGVTFGPGNDFNDLIQGSCVPHVDSMQVVNGCCFTFTGNIIRDSSNGLIGFAFEVHSATTTNSVFGPGIGVTSLCLSGDGNVVQHNTFVDGDHWLCNDTNGNPETNVEWSDNVQYNNPGLKAGASFASGFPHHDLCLSIAAGGENDTCAGTGSLSNQTPSWAGGASSGWDEWSDALLNGGSAGKGAASDGQDIGIDADLLP